MSEECAAELEVLVFAGAGASKAVRGDAYPTTREFFERLPDRVRSDAVYQLLLRFVRDSGRKDVDVEVVLWLLTEMKRHLEAVVDRSGFFGWSLSPDKLSKLFERSFSFGEIRQSASDTIPRIGGLISRINEQVYSFYSREPSEDELEANWLPLLRGLHSMGHRVEVFTTNYDLVIEEAVSVLGRMGRQLVDVGWSDGVVRRLELEKWREVGALRGSTGWTTGRLTKLHGSVNWDRSGADILVGTPVFQGSHEQRAIIYPGFKGRPEVEPFILFHDYLGQCLSRADVLIFIGFAFRDEHINDLCVRFASPKARIFVLNPLEQVAHPFPTNRVNLVPQGFDRTAVETILEMISLS